MGLVNVCVSVSFSWFPLNALVFAGQKMAVQTLCSHFYNFALPSVLFNWRWCHFFNTFLWKCQYGKQCKIGIINNTGTRRVGTLGPFVHPQKDQVVILLENYNKRILTSDLCGYKFFISNTNSS